jgi:hypothetical protein
MNDDPLLPYLFEIISQPEAEGMILGGGFGMRMKQQHLRESGQLTLVKDLPEARATQDLDVFLNLQLWIEKERAIAYREMLLRLGYEVAVHSWRFRKPYSPDVERNQHDGVGRSCQRRIRKRFGPPFTTTERQ